MTKLVSTICILGLASLLLASCSNMPANSAQTEPTAVQTNSNNQQSEMTSTEILLAEHTDAGVQLIGIAQTDSETYAPLTLKIGNESKTYQWQTVNHPDYPPQISVADLNRDGKNEIYVQLVKGYGTNILDSQLHILSENFNELTSPNPSFDIKNTVKTIVDDDTDQQIYKLTLNGTIYSFTFNEADSAMWFEDFVFGKMTSYYLENQQLHVTLSVQVSPTISVGTLRLSYQYVDKQYKLNHMELLPADSDLAEAK